MFIFIQLIVTSRI